MMEIANQRVLVVGLARSGRAVAHRLAREGARVTVTDLRPPSSFLSGVLKDLMAQRIGLELGLHRQETFLAQHLIVVSPGVPWDLPQLDAARRENVPVVPEVEVASWFFDGTLVGVTGTNGKTTTTTLLGTMLDASGYPTFVAGNIGVPLIASVDLYTPDSIVVAELSSFQLEATRDFRPHVAVLLNVTENHLDRHRTFAAYVGAKAQIFRNQTPDDYAVLNADDPTVMSFVPALASRKVFFSLEQDLPEGVLLSRGKVYYRVGHLERMLFEEREIRLRGRFNVQNVCAAAAAACVLGADFKAIRGAVREFAGVEHRLEFVRTVRGIEFYNDSKATSVDATAKALTTFERGVHLILGGKDKGAPYDPLRPLLEGRVKSIYLIGAAAEKIAAALSDANLHFSGDLKTAVESAFARAVSGDVVLLSPACASYDQFRDFEERGRIFKEIVRELPEVSLATGFSPQRSASLRAVDSLPSSAPDPPPQRAARPETPPPVVVENKVATPSQLEYIYEVDGYEAPPGVLAGMASEPAEVVDASEVAAVVTSEPSSEPISPYEVIEGPHPGEPPEASVATSASLGDQIQAGLFPAALEEKRIGKVR